MWTRFICIQRYASKMWLFWIVLTNFWHVHSFWIGIDSPLRYTLTSGWILYVVKAECMFLPLTSFAKLPFVSHSKNQGKWKKRLWFLIKWPKLRKSINYQICTLGVAISGFMIAHVAHKSVLLDSILKATYQGISKRYHFF